MIIGILIGAAAIIGGMVWLINNLDSNTALGFIVLGVALIFASTVFAHDHNRPGLDSWFKALSPSPGGVPCCDGSDAKRLDDVDWETKDGNYRVRIDGQWVDVPPSAVLKQPNLAGPTMVWPWYKDGNLAVRCFMLGTMS
jgi:hypothetical protein